MFSLLTHINERVKPIFLLKFCLYRLHECICIQVSKLLSWCRARMCTWRKIWSWSRVWWWYSLTGSNELVQAWVVIICACLVSRIWCLSGMEAIIWLGLNLTRSDFYLEINSHRSARFWLDLLSSPHCSSENQFFRSFSC